MVFAGDGAGLVALEQLDAFARSLALWAGLPFLLGATLINLGLFFARRK